MKHHQHKQAFSERVRAVVAAIPRGKTLTYKEVALRCGSPQAYRAVGSVLRRNFDRAIPCHRVVRSNGVVGDYNRGGPVMKHKLLREEGALGD